MNVCQRQLTITKITGDKNTYPVINFDNVGAFSCEEMFELVQLMHNVAVSNMVNRNQTENLVFGRKQQLNT